MSSYIKNISKLFTLALGTFIWSCADELQSTVENSGIDENAITLSIFTEDARVGTRSNMSGGVIVNRLYYQIFEKKKGADEKETYIISEFYHNDEIKPKEFDFSPSERENFTVKLLPDPEATEKGILGYKIVCWAQYQEETNLDGKVTFEDSRYYDLTDFPTIKVKYTQTNEDGDFIDYHPNNDLYRDAFYASKEFSLNAKGIVTNVELTRPFAQINVGTSGWDYEGMATIEPDPQKVKFSKIKLKGVATKLDLLEDKTLDDPKDLIDVTYSYSVIPAYSNLTSDELKKVNGVYSEDTANIEADPENEIEEKKGVYTVTGKSEEFLKISFPASEKPQVPNGVTADWGKFDVDKDGFADYIGWLKYDKKCIESKSHEELLYNIYTETFKYLSMSYVLVPFNSGKDSNTLEVYFDCATADENGNISPTGIFGENKNVIDLKNVPAAKNHRTNIIAADGTGFFMSSNEINVAINYESFADYYKRLRALDDDWDRQEQGDENGDDLNDKFEWQEDDIDPEGGKMGIVIPDLIDTGDFFTNVKNRTIDAIRYFDDNITFRINPKAHTERYKAQIGNYIDFNALKYEFYLDGEILNTGYTKDSDGNYTITLKMSKLREIADRKPISYKTISLNEYEENEYDSQYNLLRTYKEVPPLKYWPIKFSVKTIFNENNHKFSPSDLIVTVRLFSSYKFTFSQDSKDEGVLIWNDIVAKGAVSTNEDEKDYYFIEGETNAVSPHLIAQPRNTPNNANDKMVAFPDHLRLKGAANDKGHWIILKNLKENCKITAKLGRDAGVDNSGNQASGYLSKDRGLHVNWDVAPDKLDSYDKKHVDHKKDEIDDVWEYIPVKDVNIGTKIYHDGNDKTKKTLYKNTESKIYKSIDTKIPKNDLSTGKDVTIYVCDVGHSYYWIILSEPEN